eukprot:scaffold48446_cov68-Phaeocystis_antarctica.AAC.3
MAKCCPADAPGGACTIMNSGRRHAIAVSAPSAKRPAASRVPASGRVIAATSSTAATPPGRPSSGSSSEGRDGIGCACSRSPLKPPSANAIIAERLRSPA